jgi:glucose/mannose transport system substrate-binding protein
MNKQLGTVTLGLATIAFLQLCLGCSNAAPVAPASDGSGGSAAKVDGLELSSWWIAAGEVDALNALIGVYQKVHPGAHVNSTGHSNASDLRAKLDRDIDTSPPDVFQINAHDLPAWAEVHPGTLSPLDDLLSESAVKDAVLPDVLKQVSVDTRIMALPVGIHRQNALFFNRSIFAKLKQIPPTTIPELLEACETIKAAGVTPIALSKEGWFVRILFNEIAQGTMGTDTFGDFITGKKPITDAALSAQLKGSISTLSELLTNYVNPDAGDAGFGWSDAADRVFHGEAAMLLHGDWAKGYFVKLGWTPGIDFGQVGGPGASDLFWYVIDAFATPTLAPHSAEAHDFLSVVLSKDAQVEFSRFKGSTPIRTDVLDQLDRLGQATLLELVDSKLRLPIIVKSEWDEALHTFALDLDQDALFQAYVDNPP